MTSLAKAHRAVIAFVTLAGTPAIADPYTIDGTAPNRWPAVVAFYCALRRRHHETGRSRPLDPPPTLISLATIPPASLCATKIH